MKKLFGLIVVGGLALLTVGCNCGGAAQCTPDCTGKCGGPDSCGGACPNTCPQGQTCQEPEYTTCSSGCTPDCLVKLCGDEDGCGGKCTVCPTGQTCNQVNWQCEGGCAPDCTGKTCGQDDGCGGKCTSCPAGQTCNQNNWVCEGCTDDCPVDARRCLDGDTYQLCGNWDGDPCLEWGGDTDCSGGCADGACLSVSCQSPCDCSSGEVCQEGKCKYWQDTFGPYLFCCDDLACPAGGDCVYPDGVSGSCAGGTLSLSVNPPSLPSGTVNTAYRQTVTMTASGGSPPYAYTCSGTGVTGITASASNNTCTINGTPTSFGTFKVDFSVTDSKNETDQVSISFDVNSADGNCIDITAYEYPKYSPDISIPSQDVVNYCFTISNNASTIQITMSSRDWWTSSHVFLSDMSNQTKDEILNIINSGSIFNTYPNPAPWYNLAAGSNERVYVYNYPGQAGQKFYVTVYNTEPTASSLIQLYWIAY